MEDILLDNKNNFILKQSEGYGGRGIYFGKELSHQEWYNKIKEVCKKKLNYIVQEYVKIQIENFPAKGSCKSVNKFVNLGVWVCGGKYSGITVRGGDSEITNVKNGSGVTGVGIWKEEY